ncbi:MAG: hypothetical protein ABFD92_17220 [Planctomycetaceae bacterium]|nr:hypothetical protein [Planctomycetaceae bacterium]
MPAAVFLTLALTGAAALARENAVFPSSAMPAVRDYTFMWWAHGWRDPRRVLALQSGHWGMAVDVPGAKLTHLGVIAKPVTADEAAVQDNAAVFSLPQAALSLRVRAGGAWYTCTGGAAAARIIESGRFVQRADIEELVFADSSGRKLDAAGRLEIIAWPDRVSFMLEVSPRHTYARAALAIEITAGGQTFGTAESEKPWNDLSRRSAALTLAASDGQGWVRVAPAAPPGRVEGTELRTAKPVAVAYDAARQWHRVELPDAAWFNGEAGDRLDRVALRLRNPSDRPQTFRLLFADDDRVPHITGISPMIRDAAGNPTGVPVQISKNWHRKPGEPSLYQGPWLHAFTQLRVPAGETVECELTIAHGWWGMVPAVSHAQLCLIGWGVNQLWDQAAIGSWGESICYDPDVNLNRGMIDDVRPLMVWAMGPRPEAKWSWTQNVGGGDFGDYHIGNGGRRFFTRMRTHYRQYGPCLTDVTYAGISPDGAISMRATASSPRCDDITRGYYHVRYDFHRAIQAKRLELFRLGADRYNDPDASQIAWGQGQRMIGEAAAAHRQGYQQTFPLAGAGSWMSLHGAGGFKPPQGGAWANRGMIVRQWQAGVGGKSVAPHGAIIGTSQGKHASAALVCATNDFRAGDYIEFVVEMVILPVRAADYYGPNENLRTSLKTIGDSWQAVARQAAGNTLQVNVLAGTLERAYPPQVKVAADQTAAVEITGGVGYVPVTFSGLKSYRDHSLWMSVDGKESLVDQSRHGADFWQTDYDPQTQTWRQTYNVPLDSPGDVARKALITLKTNPKYESRNPKQETKGETRKKQ